MPPPYRDELLYSLLARLWRLAGSPSPGAYAAAVYGRRSAVATPDLPCGLAELAPRLGLDADDILGGLTLFPFHAAFLTAAARRDVRNRMLTSGKGLHLRLGIAASGVPVPSGLRFCPACYDRMVMDRGEAWWRRAHQLPGVCICPDHGVVLRRSLVVFSRSPRHAYLAADRTTCPVDAPMIVDDTPTAALERLWTLSRAAAALLETSSAGRGGAETYRLMLRDAGLMRSDCKVDVVRMEAAYRAYWGQALPLIPGGEPGPWLLDLVRSRRRSSHPLRHVLLSLSLDVAVPSTLPFGAGPWECLNPLAAHRGRNVVRGFRCRRDHGKATATFSCGCGYVYTRRLAGGMVGPPRFKAFGPLLEPALRRMLAAAGATRRGIASRLGLDAKTMIRLAHGLGLVDPWSDGSVVEPPRPARTERSTHARRGRREILTRASRLARRDWKSIDDTMVLEVRSTCAAIIAEAVPVRVTIAELERRLGALGSLRRRRHRLPTSWALARSVVESVGAFRCRRIEAAIARLDRGERCVSRVMREAGVGAASKGEVVRALNAR